MTTTNGVNDEFSLSTPEGQAQLEKYSNGMAEAMIRFYQISKESEGRLWAAIDAMTPEQHMAQYNEMVQSIKRYADLQRSYYLYVEFVASVEALFTLNEERQADPDGYRKRMGEFLYERYRSAG